MNGLLFAGGALLIVVAMVDALWTTLANAGAGPITSLVSAGTWNGALAVHRRMRSNGHHGLVFAGIFVLLLVIGLWIVALWAGWTMIFSAEYGAVVDRQTNEVASLVNRIYFSGFTLFTLGIGDYVPQGGLWPVLTALASLNGLFLITLSITYLIPVASAAAEQRTLAASIHDLGATPVELLLRAWDGEGFRALENHLTQLLSAIEMHTERHVAYPVVHYLHSSKARAAIGPSIARLDEALLLLTDGIDPSVRLSETSVMSVSAAIEALLMTLDKDYVRPADEPPSPPDLDALRAAGIPTVGDADFERAVDRARGRRCLLRAFVEDDGWRWDVVAG